MKNSFAPLSAILIMLSAVCSAEQRESDWSVTETGAAGAFAISANKSAAPVWVDAADHKVVHVAAGLFAGDVERVTGNRPAITNAVDHPADEMILVGTLGNSAVIDRLVAEKRIDVSTLQDRWESFRIELVENPVPGLRRALVIVGSDRRGTAYGLLTLSEAMGVSPWYWWADVAPAKKEALFVHLPNALQDGPDVKYRGIFINDERFGGLVWWAAAKMDTDLKNIGPKTYARIFELLLRLKANYLWPAMHPGTRGFNASLENPELADAYGIVMGSSHCEILLRNNEDEWKKPGTYGRFNYATNRTTMIRYWEDRVRTNGLFENSYTIGLRGVHDTSMEGAKTLKESTALTQLAIDDQRDLLAKYVNPYLTQVCQVFCAYKEVLEIYQNGLNLAPEVTLLWADDNHGFIRNLSTPEEQKRPGGSGVYYHLSYYGDPESYLWISSISPALIASEMGKAYAYGADKIWVFNVGDIKPAEKELTFAMEMAWNTKRWTPANAHTFIRDWSARTFGPEFADDIGAIMSEYYRLAAATKPEQTWLIDFAPRDLEARLAAYRHIAAQAVALEARIPEELQDAYFQLVLYPVVGAARLNELHLLSRRSLQRAEQGDDAALIDAQTARAAIPQLDELTRSYGGRGNGKWSSIISWSPGQRSDSPSFKNTPYATEEILAVAKAAPAAVTLDPRDAEIMPPLQRVEKGLRNAAPKRTDEETGGAARFIWQSDRAGTLPIWFLATTPITWQSFKPEHNSFWLMRANGNSSIAAVKPLGNIWHLLAIGPQWSRVGEINIKSGENELVLSQRDPGAVLHTIHIGLTPPPPTDPLLTLPAAQFSAKHDSSNARVVVWRELGTSGQSVSIEPFTAPSLSAEQLTDAPWVEYKISLPDGAKTIEIRTLPTQRIHEGRGVRYAVSLEKGVPCIMDIQSDEFSSEWSQNVLLGYSTRKIPCEAFAGKTVMVRIHLLDPGVVLDAILAR